MDAYDLIAVELGMKLPQRAAANAFIACWDSGACSIVDGNFGKLGTVLFKFTG